MMVSKSVIAIWSSLEKVGVEVLEEVEEHAGGRLGVLRRDALQRIMADAAAEAHEQHGDRAESGTRHCIVAGAAGQPQGAVVLAAQGEAGLKTGRGRRRGRVGYVMLSCG